MVLGTRSAASRSRVAFSVRPSASRMSATSPQKHAFFPISQLSEAFRRTGCAPRGDPPAHHKRTLFFRLRSSVKLFVEEKAREEAFRRPWQKAGVSEPQGHLSLGEVDDDIRVVANLLAIFNQIFARFRLYRQQSLQESTRFAAVFKISEII